MKKLLFISLMLSISLSGFSQFKFKGVGGGLSLGSQAALSSKGTSTMGFGFHVNGLGQITEKIDAEAAFVFYLPSSPIPGFSFHVMTFNINGHYNFLQKDKITAYGLAGLNLSMATAKVSFMGISGSSSSTKVGLNLGVGGSYGLNDKIDVTGQLGYTISNLDQLFINLGILYKL